MKLVALGEEFLLQKKQRRIKLGEEEQAAVCLMALSCGFVFAWRPSFNIKMLEEGGVK